MSNIHVSIVRVSGVSDLGSSALVETSSGLGTAEVVVSGAVSAATTLAAASQYTGDQADRQVWRIANCGTDHVYVAFGPVPPTAASVLGKAVPAGTVCYFRVGAFGDKVAVINI